MHWRLFVKFSCESHLISTLRFITCVTIGLLTSSCHNIHLDIYNTWSLEQVRYSHAQTINLVYIIYYLSLNCNSSLLYIYICQTWFISCYLRSGKKYLRSSELSSLHYLRMWKIGQNDFQFQLVCCASMSHTGHIFWIKSWKLRRQQDMSLLILEKKCQFQLIFRMTTTV